MPYGERLIKYVCMYVSDLFYTTGPRSIQSLSLMILGLVLIARAVRSGSVYRVYHPTKNCLIGHGFWMQFAFYERQAKYLFSIKKITNCAFFVESRLFVESRFFC